MDTITPEMLEARARAAGLTGARRIDGAITPAETLREVAEGTSVLAAALADGRIDHSEMPALPIGTRRP